MKCPKCSYDRKITDEAPDWQCPACGVAYAKVLQPKQPNTIPAAVPERGAEEDEEILQEKTRLASQGQKIVIYSILLNFLLRAIEQSKALPILAVEALSVCVAVYSLIGIVKICSGLGKGQNQKILFMALSFIPLINLIALVYLSAKTSKALREAGLEVGLLGAKS